jgi:ketopantoate reductase
MRIDIEQGCPSEIDYINGKIAFFGHELNVPVEVNTVITSMIKAKEHLQMQKKNKDEFRLP